MSKQATIPAAHRCAFAGAVHLMLREPDRIAPYRDIRHEGGEFRLYASEPPAVGTDKAAREAFYDAPDTVLTGKDLAALLTGAGVQLGKADGPHTDADRFERGHGKTGGWLVFADERLLHVGRSLEDVRTVLGRPAPEVPDHRDYAMTFGIKTMPKLKGGRYGAPIVREGGGEVERTVAVGNVAAEPAPARRESGWRPKVETDGPSADVVPIRTGKVRADGLPARKSGEAADHYAIRAAADTGQPVYVNGGWRSTRVSTRAGESRPWVAYLPNGTSIRSQYGRTSKAGQEKLREVSAAMARWREAVRKDAERIAEPEPVAALEDAATEPEPAVETNGPSQPDVVPPSAEVVAHAATVADGLPEHVEEWLARLIHAPKADYARAYARHVILAEPAPADPGEGWADKARRRLDRIAAGMVNA